MEKKFKGLVAINDVLDDRYQKLCDRYHSLELSHNRKRKALELLRKILYDLPRCGGLFVPEYSIDDLSLQKCLLLIDDALWSDGRERRYSCRKKK